MIVWFTFLRHICTCFNAAIIFTSFHSCLYSLSFGPCFFSRLLPHRFLKALPSFIFLLSVSLLLSFKLLSSILLLHLLYMTFSSEILPECTQTHSDARTPCILSVWDYQKAPYTTSRLSLRQLCVCMGVVLWWGVWCAQLRVIIWW